MARKLTRRDFLRIGVVGASATVLAGCKFPRRWEVLEPYVTPPEEQLSGQPTWYASTCRQCPAGCGIIVRVMNGRALKLEGNPEHPLNKGKLCARGQAGLQVLYNPDRLEGPVRQSKRGSRDFQRVTWEAGLNTLAEKLGAAGGSVAVWLGSTTSGHLYDLFQRFLSAVGAPAPLVFDLYTAFHGYTVLQQVDQQLFSQAQLPSYDLGNADVVFSFGADLFGTWLSSVRYGYEFGQFRSQELGKRGLLVALEPRTSLTAAKADKWVPLKPGTEALVAGAIASLIASRGFGPAERVDRAKALAGSVDVNAVAAAADIPADELVRLAQIFAQAERPVAIPGSQLTGQPNAAEASAAVQVLNLIAGNFGQPGGVSFTQAPPAANLVKPPVATVSDVNDLISRMAAGQIQVLIVHGANPAYELPQKDAFMAALGKVPFVVSFAPIVDETAAFADLILPDRTYLESWGYEVVSPAFGTPIVGSQQPVVMPVYDLRAAGDVLLTVAKAIPAAAAALHWNDEVEFLKEMIAQLPAGAAGGSGSSVLWSRFLQHGGWWPAQVPSQPAQPAANLPAISAPAPQYQGEESQYPFFLHPYMSMFLSDGRGANQPWLQGAPDTNTSISWQTWVEINPTTAQKLGLKKGDIVRITSPFGSMEAGVYVYPGIRPDTVAIPLGQGHTDYGRYARNRGANVLRLLNPQQGAEGHLDWSTVRVKVEPTGRRMAMATFEWTEGVMEGFPNKSIPGY